MEKDTEVSGSIRVTLYMHSDVKDTDLSVKLVDVAPDGTAYNLHETMQRVRYREGYGKEVFMEGNKVYKIEFTAMSTSNVFKKGHSIRIDIAGSNFPQYSRNLNTGGPIRGSFCIRKLPPLHIVGRTDVEVAGRTFTFRPRRHDPAPVRRDRETHATTSNSNSGDVEAGHLRPCRDAGLRARTRPEPAPGGQRGQNRARHQASHQSTVLMPRSSRHDRGYGL